MKQRPRTALAILLILLLILTVAVAVLAQTSSGFNLEWHVIGGGGGQSTSAAYHVEGTIGQGLASPPLSGNGPVVVSSGYHYAASVIHLPLVMGN